MILLTARVTDDILIAERIKKIDHFFEKVTQKVNVRKVVIDDRITFHGCEIFQNGFSDIRFCMNREHP